MVDQPSSMTSPPRAGEGGGGWGPTSHVKLCGLRRPEDIEVALAVGADLVGFVFAASKRRVEPGWVAAVTRGWRGQAGMPKVVGVFVNQPLDEVRAIADQCGLHYVQLSGSEPAEYAQQIGWPVIRAIRPTAEAWPDRETPPPALYLADAPLRSGWGGTGQSWDWEQARPLIARRPVLLAGGLTPETVGAVVASLRPWGVDVSSGIETEGVKDPAKMRAFVTAARSAASLPLSS